MKTIFLFLISVALLMSCEKPPTIEEAKQESRTHLLNDGLTDIRFVDGVEPTCDASHRYRFSFTAVQDGDNVKGCICWTEPTRIFIHIYERGGQQ